MTSLEVRFPGLVDDLVEDFGFSPEEQETVRSGEVETLAAYVKALGGKLKIIADFGATGTQFGSASAEAVSMR